MKHLELDVPDNTHKILKNYSDLSGKPIESIAVEKLLAQLKLETHKNQTSKTV